MKVLIQPKDILFPVTTFLVKPDSKRCSCLTLEYGEDYVIRGEVDGNRDILVSGAPIRTSLFDENETDMDDIDLENVGIEEEIEEH